MSLVARACGLGPGITPPSFVPLGLRGLQVYSLHREERPNYRLRCLQWLHRQPQWPTWGWNQISCPCSWQQGLWDSRFQPISMGNTSFPSLGASPLSPISPATYPLLTPDLSFPGHPGPLPRNAPHSRPPPPPLGLSTLSLSQAGGASAAGSCAASLPGAGACAAATGPGASFSKAGECPLLGSLVRVSTEISPPPSLELPTLLCRRPGLGSKPSSGTRRKKPFVPIPSQLPPLSGH